MKSLIARLSAASLAFSLAPAFAQTQTAVEPFFATLKTLCGQRFEGVLAYPTDPKHDFAGKRLVADFNACAANEIRVPFQVGEDRSRTWVITREPTGLYLRHDHRHADGSPDPVTMYGGPASGAASPRSQAFAADDYTAKLINGAATNVWTISVSPDGGTLTYHLERDAKPRVTAVFKRVQH